MPRSPEKLAREVAWADVPSADSGGLSDRAFAAIVIACIAAFTLTLWLTRPQPAPDPGPLRAECRRGDLVFRQGARVVTVAIDHRECA